MRINSGLLVTACLTLVLLGGSAGCSRQNTAGATPAAPANASKSAAPAPPGATQTYSPPPGIPNGPRPGDRVGRATGYSK